MIDYFENSGNVSDLPDARKRHFFILTHDLRVVVEGRRRYFFPGAESLGICFA